MTCPKRVRGPWVVLTEASRTLGHPEVEERHEVGDRARLRDEDVGGLDVAMNDVRFMRDGERREHLHRDEGGARRRELAFGRDELPQALPANQLHHEDRRLARLLDELDDLHDVRVTETRGCLRLAAKAPQRIVVAGELGEQRARDLGSLAEDTRHHHGLACSLASVIIEAAAGAHGSCRSV